jgi:hypothetical protein
MPSNNISTIGQDDEMSAQFNKQIKMPLIRYLLKIKKSELHFQKHLIKAIKQCYLNSTQKSD